MPPSFLATLADSSPLSSRAGGDGAPASPASTHDVAVGTAGPIDPGEHVAFGVFRVAFPQSEGVLGRPASSRWTVRFLVLALLALNVISPANPARATTYTWGGGGADGNWSTAGNWSGGKAPTSSTTTDLQFAGNQQLTVNAQANYTLRSLTFNSGAGAFTLGGGTLTLSTGITQNSANTERINNAITLSGAQTWTVNAGSLNLGSTATINGGTRLLTVNTANGASATFNGVLSGSGGLTKSGAGTLTLTANETSSGTTTISAGTLQIGNGGTSGGLGTAGVSDNGTLAFNRSDDITVANVISGTGGLTLLGGDTLTLTAADTFTGTTTISAGTLQIGNGGTSGSLASASIVDNAALAFNRSDSLSVAGVISGGGSVTQLGGGTLTLAGSNSYTGATNLNAGILNLGSAGALGTGGIISFGGGTLQYSAANQADYSGRFSTADGQAVSIDTNGQAVIFASALASNGGSLTVLDTAGAGVLTLTGNNSYTGATNLDAGTLNVGSAGALGGGGAIVFGGGTLQYSAANTQDYSARFSAVDGQTINIDTNGQSVTFAGALPTGGSLTKLGSGILALNAANTYTGTTAVNGGTLTVPADASLNGGGNITVGSGGTFNVLGSVSPASGSLLTLDGSSSQPATAFLSGTAASLTVGADMYGRSEIVGNNGYGVFNQSGGTNNAGVLNLGYLTGSNGTYNLSGTGTLSTTGNENVGYSGTGTFNQTGGTNTASALYVGLFSPGTYNLSGTGALSVNNETIGCSSTGTFNQTGGTNVFAGQSTLLTIGDGTGGSGTFNLSGTGILAVGTEYVGAGGGAGAFVQTGGTHTVSSQLYVGSNSGLGTYNLSGTGTLSAYSEYIGFIGSGTFTQSGGTHTVGYILNLAGYAGSVGTYNLSGTGVLSAFVEDIGSQDRGTFNQSGGTNTPTYVSLADYTGGSGTFNLNGGVLATTSVSAGSGTSVFNFNGGTLRATYISDYVETRFLSNLTAANVQAGGALIDTNGYSVVASQALLHDPALGATPDGGLVKTGAGTLTLSGVSTYNGGTTVAAGTLQAGTAGSVFGTGSVTVQPGAMLDLNGQSVNVNGLAGTGGTTLSGSGAATLNLTGGAGTYAGVLADGNGTLALTVSGGTNTLTGTNTYSGTTTVGGNGTLALSGGGRLANTGGIVLNAGGTLLLNGGAGAVSHLSSTTPVTLAGGTLAVAGSMEGTRSAVGVGALTLTANSTLDFQQSSGGHVTFGGGFVDAGNAYQLTLANYLGGPEGNNPTQLLFNQDMGSYLNDFQFAYGSNLVAAAQLSVGNGFYELVPVTAVPEPATWLSGALLLGAAALSLRRRMRARLA